MNVARFLALSAVGGLLALGGDARAQTARHEERGEDRDGNGNHDRDRDGNHDRDGDGHSSRRHQIPELDPAAVGAFAVLVTGGALVIARRRKR